MRAQLISIALALATLGTALPASESEIDKEYGVRVEVLHLGSTGTSLMKLDRKGGELAGAAPLDGIVGIERIRIAEKGTEVGRLACHAFKTEVGTGRTVTTAIMAKTEDSGKLDPPVAADYLSCISLSNANAQ